MPEDFRFFTRTKKHPSNVVQRLHGSLDKPWSIVAGSKENLYDISHAILAGQNSGSEANPFKILRRVLDVLDQNIPKELSFPPYMFLRDCIKKANRIIFIGYSFQDVDLVSTLKECCSHIQEFIVVDQLASEDLNNRIREFPNVELIRASAEAFVGGFVRDREPSKSCIKLPFREQDILRSGPKYITNYPHKRITPQVTQGDPVCFFDPIYGEIAFDPDVEGDLLKIIDTGEVQRLRQIKQLSFAHFKYHGATHDRFSHSLGVAYLSDLLMRHWRSEGQSRVPKKFEKADHVAFTACCLIHDIGHGPFGHTMDLVRNKLREESGHEDDTVSIFEQIFSRDCFADLDIALDDVATSRKKMMAILPSSNVTEDSYQNELGGLRLVLSNNGCDVDRLDFVMRDAAATLASLGKSRDIWKERLDKVISNYLQILHGMRLRKDESGYVIAHDDKCREALVAFGYLYKELYEKVYYGWQNVAGRVMLADAATEMIRSRKLEFRDIKPLTDVELLATLEEFENPKVSEMAYLVKYRRLFSLDCSEEVSQDQYDGALDMEDRDVVENLLRRQWMDGMLVARCPSKEVFINFYALEAAGSSGGSTCAVSPEMFSETIYPTSVASVAPRIMVFRPPL